MIIIKIRDTAKNFDSKVRESANFAVRGAKKLSRETGARLAGSESEKKAQQIVAKEAERFSDDIITEEFKAKSGKVSSAAAVISVFMLLSAAIYAVGGFVSIIPDDIGRIMNIAALALACLSLLFFFSLTVLEKPIALFFSKSVTSSNVICKKEASGDLKRRIVFFGNIDSPLEWRYMKKGMKKVNAVINLFGVCIAISVAIDACSLFYSDKLFNMIFAGIECIVFIFALVSFSFFGKKNLPVGANGNLSGVFAALSMLQYLDSNEVALENTQVWAVSLGAKESSLAGAKAFAAKHFEELKNVETLFIGFDTLADPDALRIYNKDSSGTALDAQAAKLLQESAEDMELGAAVTKAPRGGTDAAAIKRRGMKAATVCALDPNKANSFRTSEDNEEALNIRAVEAAVKVGLDAMFIFDEKGFA